MASKDPTAPTGAPSHVHPTDRTDARIMAFLDSIEPLRGCPWIDEVEATIQRGRALIERLAGSAEEGEAPSLRLTASEAADVLGFLHRIEPVDSTTWYKDGEISHVLGRDFVIEALELSLRELDKAQSDSDAPELPKALQDYLLGQQRAACELRDLLERLDAENDTPVCLGMAARAAADLQEALDSVAIAWVIENAAPCVILSAFPLEMKFQVIKAIAGATGLNLMEAKERAENLPATVRALVSDSALAEELEGLGATVQVRS